MSVTHQYLIKDGSNNVLACGTTALVTGLKMISAGDVEYGSTSTTVDEIILYYIDTAGGSTALFQLEIAGKGSGVIPSINAVRVEDTYGTANSGAEWSVNGNNLLNVYFDIPSASASEKLWQFGNATPTLNLKVTVKRQTTGITCP